MDTYMITNKQGQEMTEADARAKAHDLRDGENTYLWVLVDTLRVSHAWDSATPAQPAPEAERPCTCHPDDNPPVPCAKKYAYSECAAEAERYAVGETVEAVYNWINATKENFRDWRPAKVVEVGCAMLPYRVEFADGARAWVGSDDWPGDAKLRRPISETGKFRRGSWVSARGVSRFGVAVAKLGPGVIVSDSPDEDGDWEVSFQGYASLCVHKSKLTPI